MHKRYARLTVTQDNVRQVWFSQLLVLFLLQLDVESLRGPNWYPGGYFICEVQFTNHLTFGGSNDRSGDPLETSNGGDLATFTIVTRGQVIPRLHGIFTTIIAS